MEIINRILHGDALTQLKTLEAESIDCCITSPPYWALRDYKQEGQLGLEPTLTEYITKLVEIFNEVKRVLKKTGSCWVNMGDTYNSDKWGGQNLDERKGFKMRDRTSALRATTNTIPTKSLCLIPQRFQIAMVNEGWICRNTIIWYKPNCMPSSAKDRFTVDFEYLFFFVKSQRYFFDTQYEPMDKYLVGEQMPAIGGNKAPGYENRVYSGNTPLGSALGRIKRCVWQIPTQPFADAHFAVFPEELIRTPIKASCPEYVCKKCGKPREKIIEKEYAPHPAGGQNHDKRYEGTNYYDMPRAIISAANQTGWIECNCNAGWNSGIVLDPFIGSGTVGVVAMQNARNFIGIELNQSYIDMAMRRLEPYLKQERITSFS